MDFIIFLSVLGWCGFVFFLLRLVVCIRNFYYFTSTIGRLELTLKGARIKSYGIQNNLIGFVVCVALLAAL